MDWEDRLDAWEVELELNAQLEGSDWVTLERVSAETGVSRAALRSWYRTGQVPSRLVEGPHGMQRLVPLATIAARAEESPRLRRTAQRRRAESEDRGGSARPHRRARGAHHRARGSLRRCRRRGGTLIEAVGFVHGARSARTASIVSASAADLSGGNARTCANLRATPPA